MKNKLLIAVFCLITVFFIIAETVSEDRLFSEQENRLLAEKPDFSAEALLAGSFTKDYEDYITDQFPWRDAWIRIKNKTQKMLGKKDSNGVYFISDGTLIEKHRPSDVNEEKAKKKLDRIRTQTAELKMHIPGEVYMMFVPTAGTIWKEKLPRFAEEFDQMEFLKKAENVLEGADAQFVDTAEKLRAHKEEKIYYGTDHHWTSLGAFYGYQALAEEKGWEQKSPDDYERSVVSENFYGSLQAKVNLEPEYDSIEMFHLQGQPESEISFVYEEKKAESIYFPEKLKTKDKYAYFLNGNFPLVEIEGFGEDESSILIIKDSYANCFVPFLLEHYERIYMADPRYYRSGYTELAEKYGVKDVLYLFNMAYFMDN